MSFTNRGFLCGIKAVTTGAPCRKRVAAKGEHCGQHSNPRVLRAQRHGAKLEAERAGGALMAEPSHSERVLSILANLAREW
jgi:hypothetical protein